ncbi:MAG TPA: class I SAM-dependent methyltransferase, partial [Acidimicrobiales bacterium]|nr:class I SAM-dependent methyltransferase [Acidimicrobiales bacterium]
MESWAAVPAVKEFFDDAYRAEPRYWWREAARHSTDPDDHPTSLLTQLLLRHLRGRPPGRALDLGCGEGADAIRLARLGWEVDAVEISEVGAAKAEAFAREEGVDIGVRC